MASAMTRLFLLISGSLLLAGCAAEHRHLLKTTVAPPWIFRVTATQGDQAQCTITKDLQTYISAYAVCVTLDRSGYLNIHYRVGLTVQATQPIPQELDFGDINCLMAISQATTPVMVGSVGPVPPNGLAYTCSTMIRTNGVITGQLPGPAGSVMWP